MKKNIFTYRKMSKKDAEFILQCMRENIRRYGYTTVDDLCMLAGRPYYGFTIYNEIGWRNLDWARIERSIRGYKIIFPPLVVFTDL